MARHQAGGWARGYRADNEYTFGIYPMLNPDTLLLTAALQGIKPATDIVSTGDPDGRRLVYCELGSGQGLTLNLMAARDPGGHYFGVDYNPNQVRNARMFAEAAGIKNVRFFEETFAELDGLDIPDCDLIVMHGIWSWILPELQDSILRFIRRKLKPGGLVYVSYNCAVGRSSDNPLRRLLLAAEQTSTVSDRDARVADTLKTAQAVADSGASYFKSNPQSVKRLKGLANYEPAYIEHEYLNSVWQSYFFDEVATAMSAAKLSFVGSANMVMNRPELALSEEAMKFIGRFSNTSDLELLKDIWCNTTFRSDVFTRGVQKLSAADLDRLLGPLYFSLNKRREDCALNVEVPAGSAKIPEKPYTSILDRLSEGPITGKQISELVANAGAKMTLAGVIGALIGLGYVTLAPDKVAAPRIAQALSGFEAAINDLVAANHSHFINIVPGLGTIMSLSPISHYFWVANRRRIKNKAGWVLKQLTDSGRSVMRDGQIVSDPAEAQELIKAEEANFDTQLKPLMSLGHKV